MQELKRKKKGKVDGQLIELAGRNWLMSQLLKEGVEVARPERDRGIDLIAYIGTSRKFSACPIQIKACLKSSFIVYKERYNNISGLLLVYLWHVDDSTKTVAYAMTPKNAIEIAARKGWTRKPSWEKRRYWRVSYVNEELLEDLKPFKMVPTKWKDMICNVNG